MESLSISSFVKELDQAKALTSEPLPIEFYRRHTVDVAPDLLGKILIVKTQPHLPFGHPELEWAGGRIVETEAYRADDPASHSCRGLTPRSAVMFEEPGNAYVYFIYGMYRMLNFVTEPAGSPGAVLIRALEPLWGHELMQRRRHRIKNSKELMRGPGRLCEALEIRMQHNREKLQGPVFFVCDDGYRPTSISTSPRIGIRVGLDKLWRFFITGNSYVSGVTTVKSKR